jgi:hypothetical protein
MARRSRVAGGTMTPGPRPYGASGDRGINSSGPPRVKAGAGMRGPADGAGAANRRDPGAMRRI